MSAGIFNHFLRGLVPGALTQIYRQQPFPEAQVLVDHSTGTHLVEITSSLHNNFTPTRRIFLSPDGHHFHEFLQTEPVSHAGKTTSRLLARGVQELILAVSEERTALLSWTGIVIANGLQVLSRDTSEEVLATGLFYLVSPPNLTNVLREDDRPYISVSAWTDKDRNMLRRGSESRKIYGIPLHEGHQGGRNIKANRLRRDSESVQRHNLTRLSQNDRARLGEYKGIIEMALNGVAPEIIQDKLQSIYDWYAPELNDGGFLSPHGVHRLRAHEGEAYHYWEAMVEAARAGENTHVDSSEPMEVSEEMIRSFDWTPGSYTRYP